MKKTVARPFEAGSLMLALVGFAFPAMLIYEAVSIILKGLAPERIVVIAVAAALTYFISVSALKIIFMSKFTFYEDHFEAVYFDAFMDHAKTFYKPIPSSRFRRTKCRFTMMILKSSARLRASSCAATDAMIITVCWRWQRSKENLCRSLCPCGFRIPEITLS